MQNAGHLQAFRIACNSKLIIKPLQISEEICSGKRGDYKILVFYNLLELPRNYKLIIKLHPAESLEDYQIYVKSENVILLEHADNYELILLSDLCISQHSTILQAAIVMRKPIISLNILDLEATRILSKVIGIKKTINSWAEFKEALEILEDSNYTSLNNISFDNVIIDERCYDRIKKLIKTLISN